MASSNQGGGLPHWSSGRGFVSTDPERQVEVVGYVRSGPIERTVVVRGLGERRGTAAAAAALHEETAESLALRREREAQLRLMPETSFRGKGRPTKRQRRELDRLKDPWPD